MTDAQIPARPTVKAVLYRPESPKPAWIDFRTCLSDSTDLEELRRNIGCEWVECMPVGPNLSIWFDEEGAIHNKEQQVNPLLVPLHRIFGNVLLTRTNFANEGVVDSDVTVEELEAIGYPVPE